MSSQVVPPFIQPSAIAILVRKNEVVARSQIPVALAAMGCPRSGLRTRARAATQSLLDSPTPEFQSNEIQAHPGATDRWGLIWSSENAPERKTLPFDVLRSMHLNWKKALRTCKVDVLSSSEPAEIQRLFPADLSAQFTTARLLRASVFIDLLKRDPVTARTWRVIDTSSKPFYDRAVAATYRRSDGKKVLVVVPVLFSDRLYGADKERRPEDRLRSRTRVMLVAPIVDFYSLNFPRLPWPGRVSRFDEISNRRYYSRFMRAHERLKKENEQREKEWQEAALIELLEEESMGMPEEELEPEDF